MIEDEVPTEAVPVEEQRERWEAATSLIERHIKIVEQRIVAGCESALAFGKAVAAQVKAEDRVAGLIERGGETWG
jgi:uncharacterized membrane protein